MTDRITIYRPDGRIKTSTRRQYDRLWKQRGWRLTKPPVPETPEPAEAGTSPDTQQEG